MYNLGMVMQSGRVFLPHFFCVDKVKRVMGSNTPIYGGVRTVIYGKDWWYTWGAVGVISNGLTSPKVGI